MVFLSIRFFLIAPEPIIHEMCAAVKYMFTGRFLNPRLHCMCILNVRHYPRWTHRRPVGVVENYISEEEKKLWKLKVESEVLKRHSQFSSEELNLGTNREDHKQPSQFNALKSVESSYSQDLLKEHNVSKESNHLREEIHSQIENTYNIENVNANYTKESRYSSSPEESKTDANESVWSKKKYIKDFSFGSEEKTVIEKPLPSKSIVKRKIYDERKFKEASKMKTSADKLGVPVFTDLGVDDTILSQYIVNVKSKKRREKTRQILLEGKRLIVDAINAGVVPDAVFFTRINDLKYLNLPKEEIKIYKITYKKLSLWSEVTTSQGVLAIVKTPDISKEKFSFLPLTVVCDNIRDPGNLGTILRTCAGIGCRRVLLMKGCTDIWDPKVLRAGAGAHFRMAIEQVEDWNEIRDGTNSDTCVFIAENNITKLGSDSQSYSANKSELYSGSETDSDDDVNLKMPETSRPNSDVALLPVVPYYGFDYTTAESIVLIIGGETQGVSSEAYKFASEISGIRLNIPLSNNVESLNSGTALGVIAFEIKKQFLTKPGEANHKANEINDDPRAFQRNT